MDKRAVLARLKRLEKLRREVRSTEDALAQLSPEDRLILDYMVIRPRARGAELLCQHLQVEQSTVYRRRERALGRLQKLLDV